MSNNTGNRGISASEDVPPEVVEAIGRMRSPIVVSHVVPDADALGSMLAVARAWKSQTCSPKAALPDGSLSKRLAFLHEWSQVAVAGPADFPAADGFIVLDTAKKSRCNVGAALKNTDWCSSRPVVNIDHHATNTLFGDLNWVAGDASSTCEMVFYLICAARRPIDSVTASLLYAGIQTDTIGFSLATASPAALRASAEVVAGGADVAQLGERLCRSQSRSEFELLRVVYANTRVICDGQIAYSTASYDEIHGAGCTAADIDEQINVPRSLDGVRLAILFSEGNKGKTRLNFRGSCGVTVIELASHFGGGGHNEAAGAVLDCGLDDAVKQVLPKAEEHIEKFR